MGCQLNVLLTALTQTHFNGVNIFFLYKYFNRLTALFFINFHLFRQ